MRGYRIAAIILPGIFHLLTNVGEFFTCPVCETATDFNNTYRHTYLTCSEKMKPSDKNYKSGHKTAPIKKKKEVEENPDMHIDQDFPGYPHGHANEEIIKPKSKTQKKTAGIHITKPE